METLSSEVTKRIRRGLLYLVGDSEVAGVLGIYGEAEDGGIDRTERRKGDRALHRSHCDHKCRATDCNLVTVDYTDNSFPCDGLEFLNS